ncbi:HTH domain-containing protein [Paenibacillus sp. MMS20-IR301]|uniref:ArsR/SmtB family transcription factor n=1 Tax=Paenibacillus sp. MMS20-IR301 TaxID=2895946 RepID=UPI0028ED689B|nr:HTH domain-containing protein [Paenibacillus sp. MMS20-IR301]WNS43768.1 helix-turn-helix domain-containing protein [Paenibacillus sp. MMS20-IR301]
MNLDITEQNLPLFEALASGTRIKMIQLLQTDALNIKEMAERLGVSSAIIAKHVQQLEESGIIASRMISGKRGMQKQCFLAQDSIMLRFRPEGTPAPQEEDTLNHYAVSIPVGQYVAFNVRPTCGLASETKLIGMRDDPRYFAEPEHVQAQHLWFGSGHIDYRIPNYLMGRQSIKSIRISLEICSEAPGYAEDWPSDIVFSLNGVNVGTWTSPGDFGAVRGKLTPAWWEPGSTQHGLLKTLLIAEEGTFMDGIRLSGVAARDIPVAPMEEIQFRIESDATARRPGGVSLFGRKFGNYEQDIEVNISY